MQHPAALPLWGEGLQLLQLLWGWMGPPWLQLPSLLSQEQWGWGERGRKLHCSFFPHGVSEAAKTDGGKGPERGPRYSLVVVAYPLSMYLLLRIAHVHSQWQPWKALTEPTYSGWGEEEEKTGHNVFIIHPRHKQQAVNYQTVAHTVVAYTGYTGNCCLKKISRMVFLWLLVCLYWACYLVL